MKLTITESAIENQILTYLHYRGIFAWKNPTAGYFSVKRGRFQKQRSRFAINGVSDILGIHKGRMLCIEVKSSIGRLTPEQIAFQEKAKEHGAICIVARRIEDVEAAL